jgi:hypothetical protein
MELLFVITFMQCIYNYVLQTNRVSMVYNFTATLYLKFMLHEMLLSIRFFVLTLTLVLSEVGEGARGSAVG